MDNISDSSSTNGSVNYSLSPSCDSDTNDERKVDKELEFINKYSRINVSDLCFDLQNGIILAKIYIK